jgi:hypothetical protein
MKLTTIKNKKIKSITLNSEQAKLIEKGKTIDYVKVIKKSALNSVGDVFWVKEDWRATTDTAFLWLQLGVDVRGIIKYLADADNSSINKKWNPAQKMPMIASRNMVKIIDVKLLDIYNNKPGNYVLYKIKKIKWK